MVRLAAKEDLPAILKLIREFYTKSVVAKSFSMNDIIAATIIQNYYSTSFVLEIDNKIVGVLGGMITKFPLSDELLYQELFWFVSDGYKLNGISRRHYHLFHKLEHYCRERGITKIGAALSASKNKDKLERFFKHLGFEYLEKHYIKNLEGTDAEG